MWCIVHVHTHTHMHTYRAARAMHTPFLWRAYTMRTPCVHRCARRGLLQGALDAVRICAPRIFCQACVWRHTVAPAIAARVCLAAAAAAAAAPETSAATAGAVAAATAAKAAALEPISGKYRSEVEAAVHHALALGLPGARYVLYPGLNGHDRLCSPESSAPAAAAACFPAVGIAVPRAHELGFRALLGRFKRRAFRGDSAHVLWSAELSS